jgi:hypothetical protein
MNTLKKKAQPLSMFLAMLLLLTTTLYRSASAGMVGTEMLLQSERNQETRNYLHQLISRETIQKALVAWGVDPSEARARIDSLSENEIGLIAGQIDQLAAGGSIAGFIVIIVAVVLAVFIIVEYTSAVKMFPGL